MFEYSAQVLRVIDGDTIEVMIDLGFHTSRREHLRVLYADGSGYDAPEITLRGDTTQEEKDHGLEAKEFARGLLPVGIRVQVKTQYDKTGKFGRFLAAIRLPNGDDFAGLMTENGYTKGK